MANVSLEINGDIYEVDVEPDTPLLWVIREHLGLTGTKYGCGIGRCGTCTVLVDGKARRSCQMPAEQVVTPGIFVNRVLHVQAGDPQKVG